MEATPLYLSPAPLCQQRILPRLEESLDDCGYLFSKFKEYLKSTGCAGIVAIHFAHAQLLPDTVTRSVALFIRIVGKQLRGKIEGGYQAGPGEFFLLLVPAVNYGNELFQQDMEVIRRELRRHCTLPHLARRIVPLGGSGEVLLNVEGVFLSDRDGVNADNALFRAFQELFGSSSLPVCVKSAEQEEIEEIISGELITPVYQPIFSLADGGIYGHEALSRLSRPGGIASPEELFAKSCHYGLAYPLEMLCRKKALIMAKSLEIPGRIFLNVCPSILQADEHERGVTAMLLEELQIERSRIIFELTERTIIEDYELFYRTLSHYREQGYSIAIDDLGSGYAGLKMLARLEPEYVKLSRFLVSAIDTSATRQALVEALATFCGKIGAVVIAEGIERREELEFLVSAGIPLGQGYLLATPSPCTRRQEYCGPPFISTKD
ncbi:MAG: EAL domain-containing protein [Geobacteraceae bacterium]|nr:EAL domain-containing protein [Geobacteraceae bacterium]